MFMLEHDNTIVMEVPLWLYPQELDGFHELFGSELPLSGHIDVLELMMIKCGFGIISHAQKEKYASTQTFFIL